MAEPMVAESPDDDTDTDSPDGPSATEEPATTEDAEDVLDNSDAALDEDVETVDLGDDDLADGGDLFDDVEDAQDSSDGTSEDASDEESDEDDATDPFDLDGRSESLENAINEGAARAAVIGLDDDEQDGLEDEFQETFEAFRLGLFGARFAEEYVFVDEHDDIDPAWGLLGSALMCVGLVVWMRPDGDEMVDRAQDAIDNLAGGAL